MNSVEALIRGASPTVYVSDLGKSVTFYTETLGLKLMYQAPGEFAMIDAGDGTSIGLHPQGDKGPKPGPGASIQIGLGVCRPIHDGLPAADDDADSSAVGVEWGVPLREAWRTRGFLLTSLGQGATFFASTAVIVHQIPYLESIGVAPAAAAASVAAFTLGSIGGRVGFALLADRYEKRVLLAIGGAIVVAGMPVLATADGFWQAAVAVGIVGFGVGGTLPTRPALLADYFGTRHFGAILGLGMTLLTLGAVISPWAVGWLVDRTGEYTLGWVLCGVVATFAIPLMLLATPPSALTERHRLGVPSDEARANPEPTAAGERER